MRKVRFMSGSLRIKAGGGRHLNPPNRNLLVTFALLLTLAVGLPVGGEIKTIYVVVPTHLDIGFTAPPDTVARGYKPCIDHAIDLCEEYPDYFYTIECAWQLREWMKRSSPKDVERLAGLVKSRKIEIGGAFASMHSGMMSGESVNRMFDLGLELAKQLDATITTAIQDDVPGYTWAYPQAMRQHGIKYFLTGINTSFGGQPSLSYKDVPFYWEGPDGSRVLTWIASGYLNGSDWGVGIWEKEDAVFRKVLRQTRKIEKEGYPYDAFLVMASPGDNVDAAATEKVHRIIRRWNAGDEQPSFAEKIRRTVLQGHATGKRPVLKMATPRQFFEYMEKKYGDRFPTHRGDWSGHWAPAKLGAPRLIARMRYAQRVLPAAEALWSILALKGAARFPAEDIGSAWDDLLTISGHTASAGTGWPDLTTKQQAIWENWQHAYRGLSASHTSSMLLDEGMEVLANSITADYPFIVVFNSFPWPRSGYVHVNLPADLPGRGVTMTPKGSDKAIECDLLEDGRTLRFLAQEVPGVGYKVFRVSPGTALKKPVPVKANRLDSARFVVEVDPQTGCIASIQDKNLRREWVEKNRRFGTLHLISHAGAMMGTSSEPIPVVAVKVERIAGHSYETLRVHRKSGPLVRTSVTVFHKLPLVKIENTLDTSRVPGDRSVMALLEFPFALDAKSLQVHLDSPNHVRRYPEDSLPGTARIGQVVQGYALVHDDTAGVAFIPVEAPILSLGEVGYYPQGRPPSARLYSYLFDRGVWGQNKDTGRTRYDEVEPALGTKISFAYYLGFSAAPELDEVPDAAAFTASLRRSALEATVPLFAQFHSPWGRQQGKLGDAPARSFLEIGEAGIELSSSSIVPQGEETLWRLHLQENSGPASGRIQAKIAGLPIRSAWLLEESTGKRTPLAVNGPTLQVPVSPFRTVTVLVEPEAKTD